MTRNAVIDRARKERRLQFRAPDDMPDVVDEGPSAADDVDARELQTVLEGFRGCMTPDEATLFAARFEQGLSLSQTAKAIGWSEIKVRTVDTRLRARLLEEAQGAGFFARVKVKIGASLLARRGKKMKEPQTGDPERGGP
jgi:RNA polymerase sigma factor (sigma-70 family)